MKRHVRVFESPEEALAKILKGFLRNELKDPHGKVTLEPTFYGSWKAYLVSKAFEPIILTERQNRIWAYLDKRLTPELRARVSLVSMSTPVEVSEAISMGSYLPSGGTLMRASEPNR